jgi:SAM-dependent methyltransferase
MLSSLLDQVAGRSRLMDLACGTGQLTFALGDSFASTWAVDQEPSMVERVAARGVPSVRAVVAAAESLEAPAGSFDLIVIGNAFHRLPRDHVAASAFSWLRPGGSLALCWSDSPWAGEAPWQAEFRSVLSAWPDRLGARDRLPAGWADDRSARPDAAVLSATGFANRGRFTFSTTHRWTVATLAGFTYSTSLLPRAVFGDQAAEFEAELADRLPGELTSLTTYAYDLATKPLSRAATPPQ